MEQLFGVCGILLRYGRNGKLEILLVQEQEDDPLLGKRNGMLSPPMGHVSNGENPESAIVREIKEETGLRVDIVQRLPGVTEYPTTGGTVPFRAFEVRLLPPVNGARGIAGELPTQWMEVQAFLALPESTVRPYSQWLVSLCFFSSAVSPP